MRSVSATTRAARAGLRRCTSVGEALLRCSFFFPGEPLLEGRDPGDAQAAQLRIVAGCLLHGVQRERERDREREREKERRERECASRWQHLHTESLPMREAVSGVCGSGVAEPALHLSFADLAVREGLWRFRRPCGPGLADPQRGHRWAQVAALLTCELFVPMLRRDLRGSPAESCILCRA